MNSTYEAALKEVEAAKTELHHAQEERDALTRLLEDLGKSNKAAMQETETLAASVRQAKINADTERRQAEAHQDSLKKKIPQLIRQHTAIQGELAVAKENRAALQELVEVYQKKLSELPKPIKSPMSPDAAFAGSALDPATLPPITAQPSPVPLVEPRDSPQPLAPKDTTVSDKPAADPSDSSWLSVIKGWVLAIWRSLF